MNPSISLGDIATVKGGKRLPKGSDLTDLPTPHPYIRITDMRDGYVETNQIRYVPIDIQKQIARYTISVDDIFISIVGTIGLVGRIPERLNNANLTENAAKISVTKPEVIDTDFLCYFLRSSFGQEQIKSLTVGSTQPKLAIFRIQEIKIPTIPISTQKKIADTLKSIDQKISINTQISRNLESMAKAIFKEWFIDFGPVKAKAEGRKPFGMDDETAALFPDSFEESELGMIPKGWKISNYSSVMEHIKHSVNPETFELVDCIHYSLPNFDDGRNPKKELVTDIKSNKFRVHHNSILFSKLNPRTPRIWIANHDESENQMAVGSTEFVVINPTLPENRWLAYCLLNESIFLDRMSQTATGTSNSHQRIKPESIFETKWANPNKEIIERFHKSVKNLFELSLNNLKEIQHLTQTRDILLPKLISGDIQLENLK